MMCRKQQHVFLVFLISVLFKTLSIIAEGEDVYFPELIEADDISYFFSDSYDLDGLHWGLSNIFERSARNLSSDKTLPQTLVARGGGNSYTSEYKLKHDIDQARYLVKELQSSNRETSKYLEEQVIPIYERVLKNIPPLSELERTKGLYAFTKEDYDLGIGKVYNKMLYSTTADELDPSWKESGLLNKTLDWDNIQRQWFGERSQEQSKQSTDTAKVKDESPQEECNMGAPCSKKGTKCTKGQETCCGKTHHSFQCECIEMPNGLLQFNACLNTDACMFPPCCRNGPPIDKPPPSKGTCNHMGSPCNTGIEDDYCCFDLHSGSGHSYCTKSGGKTSDTNGVIVIDDLLTPTSLQLLRELLLKNTHWYQTKTPLEFGKYLGAYIDDGLHDPIFLELAKQLHQSLPRIMKGHHLRYLWAYKYDSEFDSGINLHADQAAINVNMWLSEDDADLEEDGYGGGLVVYTTKPPSDWKFQDYNTNTDYVVEKLLKPTNFANITVKHKANRAVIFDSTLFHQTDKYRFKKGYTKGRINLTLLFGEMQQQSETATIDASTKQEL